MKIALFSDIHANLPALEAFFADVDKRNIDSIYCLGDLVTELGLAQATISQHLRELKDIGIIQGTIEGTRVSYCINAQRWSEIQEQFNKIFKQFEDPSAKDCC